MIRAGIYLDEDVDIIVAEMFRSQGYSALTVQEAGRKGKSDPEQLSYAIENELVMLTHNRIDYQRLAVKYFEEDKTHFGIVLAVQRPVREIANGTLIILNRFSAKDLKNQIFYI